MPGYYLLENGTDQYLLETGTDVLVMEDGEPSSIVTDDFNRANANLTASGNWESYIGLGFQIESNEVTGADNELKTGAVWATAFNADQFVEVSVPNVGGLNSGAILRAQAGGADYYRAWTTGSNLYIERVVGGVSDYVAIQALTVSAGDLLRFTISGTGATVTFNVYKNGSLANTATDTNAARIVSGGKLGLYGCRTYNTWRFDNFRGGNGDGAASAVLINVPLATVSVQKLVPTVPRRVDIPLKTVSVQKLVPTAPRRVDIPLKAVSVQKLVPSVPRRIDTPLKNIVATGLAPGVPRKIDVPLKNVVAAGLIPTFSAPTVIAVPLKNVVAVGLVPTIPRPTQVNVPLKNIVVTANAPTVRISQNVRIDVPLKQVAVNTLVPAIIGGVPGVIDGAGSKQINTPYGRIMLYNMNGRGAYGVIG